MPTKNSGPIVSESVLSSDSETRNSYNVSNTVTSLNSSTLTTTVKASVTSSVIDSSANINIASIGMNSTTLKHSFNSTLFQTDISMYQSKYSYTQGNFKNVSVILEKSISIEKFSPTSLISQLHEDKIANTFLSDRLVLNALHEPPINLKSFKEFNVQQRSAFELTQPPSFVFTHLQLTEHNNRGYAFGQNLTTERSVELNNLKFREVPNANRLTFQFDANTSHTTAWMEKGRARWIKFPEPNDLKVAFGESGEIYGDLLFNAEEYLDNKSAIRAINAGLVTPFMNLTIPVPTGIAPDRIAFPLKEMPESMAYNNKYGGHLNLILERGHVQKHVLVSGAGPNFYFGGTTNYYMHGRNMIHMQGHSELTNVYKLLVTSSATYHYKCQPPFKYSTGDTPGFGQTPGARGNEPINYRYEGDFNIEQVTVDEGEKLKYYGFGIHGIRDSQEIRARAGRIRLQYVGPDMSYEEAYAEMNRTQEPEYVTQLNTTAAQDLASVSVAKEEVCVWDSGLTRANFVYENLIRHFLDRRSLGLPDDRITKSMMADARAESRKQSARHTDAVAILNERVAKAHASTLAANTASESALARTNAAGPVIEILEKSIEAALTFEHYIKISENELVLRHGDFSINIGKNGIQFNGPVNGSAAALLKLSSGRMTIDKSVLLEGNSANFENMSAKNVAGNKTVKFS